MFIPIIRSEHSTYQWLGETVLFCGRCVKDTTQRFWRISTRHKIYFIDVGADDATMAATCSDCGGSVGPFLEAPLDEVVAALGAPDQIRDKFLDAWAAVPVRRRWTPRLVLETVGLIAIVVGSGLAVARVVDSIGAAVGLWMGLGPVALLIHRGFVLREGRAATAELIAPHLQAISSRAMTSLPALEKRARALNYDGLADALASPSLAALPPAPYR